MGLLCAEMSGKPCSSPNHASRTVNCPFRWPIDLAQPMIPSRDGWWLLIKYLGSKRRLVPVLGELFEHSKAQTALDLFTGTTRVAQEFKRRGGFVTAVDTARYAEIFAQCHIATDATVVDKDDLREAVERLSSLPGRPGYFTHTFCMRSRFFQPFNGERIDAIRDAIEADFKGTPLYPILLTSLIYAADKVDSTTGVQMAYLKRWAQRSYNPLKLEIPQLYPGPGRALRGDACKLAPTLPDVDLAYLDPPYNQHRYIANYHIWETLVAWDAPRHYGVACKRLECKDKAANSVFNSAREMPVALRQLVADIRADVVILSYNDEAWLSLEELIDICSVKGYVTSMAFDSKRYVGAQIGIHDPHGRKVGKVSHLRNVEYLVVAGPKRIVRRMAAPFGS